MKLLGEAVRPTLTKKIIFLLLIPFFGSLVSIAFFAAFMEETKTDSHFINVAGRQRMLSAELRAWAHMVAIGQEEDRAGLQVRIAEFEKSLSAMERGGKVLDGLLIPAPPEVRSELAAVDNLWRALKPDLTAVAVRSRGEPQQFQEAYHRVEFGTDELKKLSHQLVTRFDERTQRLRRRMLYTLVSVACLTGIIFLAGVFLARRYIVQPILRIDEAARRIGTGDFTQRLEIATRDELSTLAHTFNQMVAQTEQLLSALNLRRRHAETIIASVPAGLLVLRGDLAVLRANRSFRETFGVDKQVIACRPMVTELLPVNGLKEAAFEVLSTGEAKRNLPMEMPAKDGSSRLLRITLAGTRLAEEEEEEEARLLVVVEDMSEEHRLRAEARAHERRFHDLVQGLDAIVWEAEAKDGDLYFTFVSRRAEILLGYPVKRLLAEPRFWVDCLHPEDREAVVSFYHRILEQDLDAPGESGEIEYRVRAADGREIWFHEAARRIADSAAPATRLRGVMVDVTARKEMESRLVHLASHDALTGLPNRNLLHDRLGQALISAARHGRAAGALFLDLDRFKVINDSLGHSAGDRLLKVVAKRLQDGVREGDTVARLGGDEFVVILDDMAQPQDAALVAQKILESFVQPFHVEIPEAGGAQEFFFTTSIGISLYPSDGEDVDTLLKNADTAMYRAKERGGNSYQFFTPEMDLRARKRLSLESALRNALERREFVLHYQPQIDLATQSVIGVEALLRWNHPEQGLIAPADFIPLLEETGLIVPVGEWVLREACAQATVWRQAGLPPLRMAVNLSARQLRHERFADTVATALADTGMDPDGLEIEITESAVMQQVEASLETLRQIHALGVWLSMDDFGTGYSSLSHLKLLPIDTVKIDRSFVRDIPADENDAAIVQAIIVLARTLRLNVIAEGVETSAQLEFLRAHGCDAMQGYLFSRPLPADEITSLLKCGRSLPPGGQEGG